MGNDWKTKALIFFREIDDRLIDSIFQPASDFVRDWIGKTNFWVAKMFAWVSIVLGTLDVALCFRSGNLFTIFLASIVSISCVLTFIGISAIDATSDAIEEFLERSRTLNFHRRVGFSNRMGSLILTALLWACAYLFIHYPAITVAISIYAAAMSFGNVPAIYFLACTPKPRKPLGAISKSETVTA